MCVRGAFDSIVGAMATRGDEAPPVPQGDYEYFSRAVEGREGTVLMRQRLDGTGEAEVILDADALFPRAAPSVADVKVSGCGRLVAFVASWDGSESAQLFVKDARGDEAVSHESWKGVSSYEWAHGGGGGESSFLFMAGIDAGGRPSRLLRSRVSAGLDVAGAEVLMEESDRRFYMGINCTKDREYVVVNLNSKTTSEALLLRARDAARGVPTCVRRREVGTEYFVEHIASGRFLIVSNRDSDEGEYGLFLAGAACGKDGGVGDEWRPLVVDGIHDGGGRDGTGVIEDIDVFRDCVAVYLRRGSRQGCRVIDARDVLAAAQCPASRSDPIRVPSRKLELAAELRAAQMTPGVNADFAADTLSLTFSSLLSPAIHVEVDMARGSACEVGRVSCGVDVPPIKIFRSHATSADGAAVPVTLAHRDDLRPDGSNPLLLVGYGAYGECLALDWQPHLVGLLRDGWIVAHAHVRGGGELGKSWHDAGRQLQKANSFHDFVAVAEHCCEGETGFTLPASDEQAGASATRPPRRAAAGRRRGLGLSSPSLTAAEGTSAGALLCGVSAWAAPDRFRALVLRVPFLDVHRSMTAYGHVDLNVHEMDEWGRLDTDPLARGALLGWDPMLNLGRARRLPHMMISGALDDERVPFWHPLKWTARARSRLGELGCDGGESVVLLNMRERGGHFNAGATPQAAAFERAQEIAFLRQTVLGSAGCAAGEGPARS